MIEVNTIEGKNYGDNKLHERCVSHESKRNVILDEYFSILRKKWSIEHVENVLVEIQETLTSFYTKQYRNSMIFTIVLKYATKNNISCNFREHQKLLSLNTKVVNKALRELRVGFISEGMCDENVKRFVEEHGDTGIVRPNTLMNRGHKATQQIGLKIKSETKNTVEYDKNSDFMDTLITTFFKNKRDIVQYSDKIRNVYLHLKGNSALYEDEGETMCCLLSLFVVLQKNHLIKNTQDFCMKTRLSSVPTIRRLMKKYMTSELQSGNFLI